MIITISLIVIFCVLIVLSRIFEEKIEIEHVIDCKKQKRVVYYNNPVLVHIAYFVFIILLIIVYLDLVFRWRGNAADYHKLAALNDISRLAWARGR